MILEVLWAFRSNSVISENVRNIKQVLALINEFYFDKLCLGGSRGMRGKKSLLNEKPIIIFYLNVVNFCDLHHPGLVLV